MKKSKTVSKAIDDTNTQDTESIPTEGNEKPAGEANINEAIPDDHDNVASQGTESPIQSASQEAPQISKAQFMQLEEAANAASLPSNDLERMLDLKVSVEVKLGSTRMPIEDILKLGSGSVIELDKLAGEPVDITANGKLIARAEVVVIEDNFGVKILEIVGNKQKLGIMKD